MSARARTLVLCTLLAGGCASARPPGGPVPFVEFRTAYMNTGDPAARESLLDGFWRSALTTGTPLVQPDGRNAVFLYRGAADSVKVTGDFTNWEYRLPLERLGSSDLFHRTVPLPPDARLDYLLVLDTGRTMLDPACLVTVPGGFGPRSEAAMPGFRRSAAWIRRPEVPAGELFTISVPSAALGYDHTVHVYLPPGYAERTERYPVVYFQDGNDYIFHAGARAAFDNLIAERAMRPAIGVFIVPPAGPDRDRRTEYSLHTGYMIFVARELVPFIDRSFRTLPHRRHRLLVGASRGGLITFGLAFLHDHLFGNAASQSGNLSWNSDSLARIVRTLPAKDLRLYADVGTFEEKLLGQPASDMNFLAGNRRMRDLLRSRGAALEYREHTDSHSWGRWRNELPSILTLFLPPER